jgi:hypothetical protein
VTKRRGLTTIERRAVGAPTRADNLRRIESALNEAEIAQRLEVLRDLEGCRHVSLLDYFKRDESGYLVLKTVEDLAAMGGSHAVFLKKIKVKSRVLAQAHVGRGNGEESPEIREQEVEIEIGPHLEVLKMLGDYLGLWDAKENKLRGATNRLLADKTNAELEEIIRNAEKQKVKV